MVRRRPRPPVRLPAAPQRRVGRGRPSEAPPGPAPRRAGRPTRARRERVVGSSGHAVGRGFDGLGRRPAPARRSRRQPPGRTRPTTARHPRHRPVGPTRQRGHPVGRARRGGHAAAARRGPERGGTAFGRHDRVRRGRGTTAARRRRERRANALGRHRIRGRRYASGPVVRGTRRRERRMVDGRSRRHTVGHCRCGRTGRSPERERRAAQRAQRRRSDRPVGWAADQRRPAGER